jgi:hypothetical protein
MDRCTTQYRVRDLPGARTDTRLPASSASRVRVRALFDVCIHADFLLLLESGAWESFITHNFILSVHALTIRTTESSTPRNARKHFRSAEKKSCGVPYTADQHGFVFSRSKP